MKNFPIIFFFLLAIIAPAQKKDTLRLYYDIDVDEPNVVRLDSFINTLRGTITEVRIIGYADFLWNSAYNIALSQRRANKVKNYLVQKAKFVEVLECSGKGEISTKEEGKDRGEPSHRRVDVIFSAKTLKQEVEKTKTEAKPKSDSATQKQNIADLNVGESMALEGLSFIPGEHYLMRESAAPLKRLLETLQKNPKLKIEIQGHVCCTKNGEDGVDLNTGEKKLSENRAKYIYDYLIGKGINADRLTYKGYGRSMPKAPLERNEAEEQMNRRVEIKILEK